jgi:signal transduction histidine kinase
MWAVSHERPQRESGDLVGRLAILGHELRNPLATIRSAAEMLRSRPDPWPELDHVAEIIDHQAEHMTRLIDHILEFATLETGDWQDSVHPVDLAAIGRDTVAAARCRLEERDLELRARIPAAPVWVTGDSTRLAVIADNLLDNAVKFTRDGGVIELSVSADERRARLGVRDSGVGIDPAVLPRVFDLFERGNRSDTSGLGLGLTLVKSLVDHPRGSVSVHSDGVGAGTEVVVELPVRSTEGEKR